VFGWLLGGCLDVLRVCKVDSAWWLLRCIVMWLLRCAKVFWMAARTLLRCSGWLLVMFNCFGCLLGRY